MENLQKSIIKDGTGVLIARAMQNIEKLSNVTIPTTECISLQGCLIALMMIREILEDRKGKETDVVLDQIANLVAQVTGPIVMKEPEADGTPETQGTPAEEGKE